MRRSRRRTIDPGLPHHITARGNNRRRLFSFPRDYLFFIFLVRRGLAKYPCPLHAMTLMANHVHMLLTPASLEQLARLMQFIQQIYASYRNERRNGSGKLFEGRYFSDPIRTDANLQNVTIYVEANPLEAGLADDPLDYPWSTYPIHAGAPEHSRIPASLITASSWYRSLGPSRALRAAAYRDVFASKRAEAYLSIDASLLRAVARATEPYTQRLERPDGTRAMDRADRYRVCTITDRSPGKE